MSAIPNIIQLDKEDEKILLKHRRGVRDICPKCKGWGIYLYCNTSGWRGGIGGSMMTRDICDTCWGSGDDKRPFLDLRKLYKNET